MASDKTLNAKNLAGLGAARLAELVLELSVGNDVRAIREALGLSQQAFASTYKL
jgi:DNA-binding transcriptional regulator YiaG